jgi:pimeloyl-ACP methyl ester carboxylesterase
MYRVLLACFFAILTGCATTQQRFDHHPILPPSEPVSGVVFVANGAGDSRTASQNLSAIVPELSLHVVTFAWSRYYKRVVADQVDHDNHLAQGRRLADEVTAYRLTHPFCRIYLLGQSAGGAVVLNAAQFLPPSSIDRMILLSPSVCSSYDLRPALQTCREGIDLFYSRKDCLVLGVGMRIFGTTERDCRVAAGRVGFKAIVCSPTDAVLYDRLRQHPWDRSVAWTGHHGGHHGNLEPRFLRAYVLPLLGGGCRNSAGY